MDVHCWHSPLFKSRENAPMPPFLPQSVSTPSQAERANAFILIEVLVAMSLITSGWMALEMAGNLSILILSKEGFYLML